MLDFLVLRRDYGESQCRVKSKRWTAKYTDTLSNAWRNRQLLVLSFFSFSVFPKNMSLTVSLSMLQEVLKSFSCFWSSWNWSPVQLPSHTDLCSIILNWPWPTDATLATPTSDAQRPHALPIALAWFGCSPSSLQRISIDVKVSIILTWLCCWMRKNSKSQKIPTGSRYFSNLTVKSQSSEPAIKLHGIWKPKIYKTQGSSTSWRVQIPYSNSINSASSDDKVSQRHKAPWKIGNQFAELVNLRLLLSVASTFLSCQTSKTHPIPTCLASCLLPPSNVLALNKIGLKLHFSVFSLVLFCASVLIYAGP